MVGRALDKDANCSMIGLNAVSYTHLLSREQREAAKQRQFALKQQKRQQKHRGH